MPPAERDPRTGLPPRAAGALHDVPSEKPLHPRNIIRQTVYCQAAIRRFIYVRRILRGVTLLRKPVSPALATALFFCKHLCRPKFTNFADEANFICAFICGREVDKGLKLGDCSDAYEEYRLHLPANHPALMMVSERFEDVVVDAEEDALQRMQEVSLPSDAEAKLREAMMAWRSPEDRPGGGAPLFKIAKELIEKLRTEHEQVLIARLPIVNTQEAYGAMMAEVEREFVGTRTILRGQVRGGRNRHRALLETELQTMYGWPPTGPGPSLKRAARQYTCELTSEHPQVGDFVSASRRHVKAKEDKCILDMTPLEAEILRFRGLVNADPPAPKLMLDNYKEELNTRCLESMQRLKEWVKELGADSQAYLKFLRSTLGTEKFCEDCEAKALEMAEELRALGPRPPPSLEEAHVTENRAIALTSLAHYLQALEADGRKAQAVPLSVEFAPELRRVEEAVSLFKDKEEDVDDGWHRPPGFEKVDLLEKAAPPPPPPPPKKEIKLERELPGMRDGEAVKMRLHGVDFEDVRRHNEILLLELCADIIAEECKIPRDCIFNLAFDEVERPPPQLDETRLDSKTRSPSKARSPSKKRGSSKGVMNDPVSPMSDG